IYEGAGVEEYPCPAACGGVIDYLQNGKYVLEQSYMLQDDQEDEYYNAELEISLRAFPNIKMKLGEIFEGIKE
ncbi:MAG: Uma2 family endonuclease, partial [Acetatifactor sp.]|nr:Uma2 family endonuclease [Acetatifactor sp.]